MKKMIVITGADGSGKSTLIERLAAEYNFAEVTIWDAMDTNLFQSKKEIDLYLCSLSSNARLLFLAHALTQSLEKSLASDSSVLILNSYFYKYFASELALGADKKLVENLISFFPRPDVVIKLENNTELAYDRKDKLSHYECGIQTPSKATFIDFQEKALKAWSFYDQTNWNVISTINSKEETYLLAKSIIEKAIL